uniref:NADH-ubiquinone oxidoreductase chain 6 n=1 Tax=Loxocephala perpunctata TaxID=2851908 RepID=A0A8F3J8I1_9HEMI|nr:NADH dehydrogenase subunit 6 [Loxocephala perpunctata]
MMKMTILILNSIITPMLKHPISLGSMLIFQTMLISIYMTKNLKSTWFSYILFITMIGGMMVMFMYMASIASNEKKFYNMINMLILMTIMIMIMKMMMKKDKTMDMFNKINEFKFNSNEDEEIKSLSKFFNKSKSKITIFMMTLLFMMMIIVTNISNTFEGPLKKKTYV